MIDLDKLWSKWSAPHHDETLIDSLNAHEARQTMRDMLIDIHDLVRLGATVREYGKARIALSQAHEAWVSANKPNESTAPKLLAWLDARAKHRAAIDRLEAVAVQLAGGNVRRVCEGVTSEAG